MTCKECKPDWKADKPFDAVVLCERHALAERMALALKRLSECTTLFGQCSVEQFRTEARELLKEWEGER